MTDDALASGLRACLCEAMPSVAARAAVATQLRSLAPTTPVPHEVSALADAIERAVASGSLGGVREAVASEYG